MYSMRGHCKERGIRIKNLLAKKIASTRLFIVKTWFRPRCHQPPDLKMCFISSHCSGCSSHNINQVRSYFDLVGSVYRPGEDSYLLQGFVERLVSGVVLDMGTGSGIQAVTAASKPDVIRVVAADINPEALEEAKNRVEQAGVISKVTLILSDLFDNIDGLFDWILFNPPYLPSEGDLKDPTWDGGKRGAELIERFLPTAREHLQPGGSILMVYSSETGLTGRYGYVWRILGEKRLFFETLYCVRLSLS
jgi:release factor glutamine methyltransferase